jgi:glycerol-3-phosphate dehydrogenase
LALPSSEKGQSSKDISRHHSLEVSDSGLITITGGKWTTYRKMGEDTVDKAIEVGGLIPKPCVTTTLKIHGAPPLPSPAGGDESGGWDVYGTDREGIKALIEEHPEWNKKLDKAWPQTYAEVVWAVRKEMALKVEDVLCRRFRVLFLNAKAAVRMAPIVAEIMKQELDKDDEWVQQQLNDFNRLAQGYELKGKAEKHVSSFN